MPETLGTFNLTYTKSTPDIVLDHGRCTDIIPTRYEQRWGRDGEIDVNISLVSREDEVALNAVVDALKGAGFIPEFEEWK